MERELFLQNLIGQSKIDSIKDGMRPQQGGVIEPAQNASSVESFIEKQFGDFGVRILGVSNRAEQLASREVTVIGGWCAIRTADMMLLQQGIITDPLAGITTQYQSANQVAEWIEQTVSIDQVIEAIGIYNGRNYVAISEEKLWVDRVESAVQGALRRRLKEIEVLQLRDAMQKAELKRYRLTKRYIEYVQGFDINLSRVVDQDIYTDLVMIRDEMLKTAGITLIELMSRYPEEKTTAGYSIVWGMYTGPYLALLQEKGYVMTQKGLIVEPWMHATSETRSRRIVNQNIFSNGSDAYLVEGGTNQNLGFVAYADVMMGNGQRARQKIPINGVPNQQNYQTFIDCLGASSQIASLTLAENPVFVWGVNLLPFGDTKNALYKMVAIKDAYKEERKILGELSREEAPVRARELRDEYSTFMRQQSEFVIEQLSKMLQYVFEDKGV